MKRLCLILFVLLLAAPAMAEEPLQLARMDGPMLGSGAAITYVFPINITGISDFDTQADAAANTVTIGETITLPSKVITKLYMYLNDAGSATECSIGIFTDATVPEKLAGCHFTPTAGINSCDINYSASAGNFNLWAQCNQTYRVWKTSDNTPDCDNYYRTAITYTQDMPSSIASRSADVGCGGQWAGY